MIDSFRGGEFGRLITSAAVVAGAGATALTGCGGEGSIKTTSFVVGVECDSGIDASSINVLSVEDNPQRHAGDRDDDFTTVTIECEDQAGIATAPTSIELLDGDSGTQIVDGDAANMHQMEISVRYEQGGGTDFDGDQDPILEFTSSESSDEGIIVARDVRSIEKVDITS